MIAALHQGRVMIEPSLSFPNPPSIQTLCYFKKKADKSYIMNRPGDPSPTPLNSHQLPPPTADGVDIVTSEVGSSSTRENIPTAGASATQEAFKRLYIILIVIGLSIGVVAAIGVVNLLNRWGLTQPPPPVEEPNS